MKLASMKVIIACLLVAVIGLALLMRSQSASIRDLERQVHELNARLLERSRTANLDSQAKCSEQARQVFAQREGDYKKIGPAWYENHYNPKLNRCFIHVRGMRVGSSRDLSFQYVFDAFEGREYGEYAQRADEPPWQCSVTLLSGEKKDCRNLREFSQLVRAYMEDN